MSMHELGVINVKIPILSRKIRETRMGDPSFNSPPVQLRSLKTLQVRSMICCWWAVRLRNSTP